MGEAKNGFEKPTPPWRKGEKRVARRRVATRRPSRSPDWLSKAGRSSLQSAIRKMTRDLPQAIRNHPGVYASCIGGAIVKEEYLRLLEAAGFDSVEVMDEMDASELLTCASGPVSDLLRKHGLTDTKGWALSVKLKATKPAGCCSCEESASDKSKD